jgi:hypothetical protein
MPPPPTITETGARYKDPENQNFLSPVGFRFSIRKLPHVNWFLQGATIPGITLGEAIQPTPFIDAAQPGEKLTFDPISISFKVDEDLKNWTELFNWMVGLGTPTNFREYKDNVKAHGKEAVVSDATLTTMNSVMNPNFEIVFHDVFPLSLGELSFDTTQSDIDYLTCTATFRYLNYEFRKLS